MLKLCQVKMNELCKDNRLSIQQCSLKIVESSNVNRCMYNYFLNNMKFELISDWHKTVMVVNMLTGYMHLHTVM